jgi:hypothetical protein
VNVWTQVEGDAIDVVRAAILPVVNVRRLRDEVISFHPDRSCAVRVDLQEKGRMRRIVHCRGRATAGGVILAADRTQSLPANSKPSWQGGRDLALASEMGSPE